MPTSASPNYTVKNLEKLLKKHSELLMERDRHEQMVKDLKAEEVELLKKTDLDNAEHFKAIGMVRMKCEIAPKKVAEFGAAAEEALCEIDDECHAIIAAMVETLDALRAQTVSVMAGSLARFFRGRKGEAVRAARDVFTQTNVASQYWPLMEHLKSEALCKQSPLFRAKAVLEVSPKIVLLNYDTEETGLPWGPPQSYERLQDQELEQLSKDPKERIELMLRGGVTREAAEKAVQGRIKHLKAEQAQRGIAKH
jgi:hypothetical protein